MPILTGTGELAIERNVVVICVLEIVSVTPHPIGFFPILFNGGVSLVLAFLVSYIATTTTCKACVSGI